MGIKSWSYSSTIVDDFSSRIHKIPFSFKGTFVERFKSWVAQNVPSRDYKINIIRSYNGTEYKNYFNLRTCWIHIHLLWWCGRASKPDNSKIGEHDALCWQFPRSSLGRTGTDCMFSSLLSPSNPGCTSPYEMLHGSPPDVSFLRVIGGRCYVHKFKPVRDKGL